jgi:hypothetical protein
MIFQAFLPSFVTHDHIVWNPPHPGVWQHLWTTPLLMNCLLVSCSDLLRVSVLIWLGFCNHCSLTCFFYLQNLNISLQTVVNVAFICNGLNSLRLWFRYFPKPCFCPHYYLSCQKFHIFEKLTWYCSITSLFNLLRSAVSTSNICSTCLLAHIFLWNCCNHWIVIIITISCCERLDIECNWMQSSGCQDVIHLIMSLIRRSPSVFMIVPWGSIVLWTVTCFW